MKKERPIPPQLPLRFFRWFCHPKMQDYIEGDLMEVYERRLKESGKRKADLRFIIDVLLLFRPGIIKPMDGYEHVNTYGMCKSYFKIGWRNLFRNKFFSAIKILGLSIGLAVCMLIVLYTKDEISYDQFHTNKEQLYRITQNINVSNQPSRTVGNTSAILGETFANEIPEVEQAVRITSDVVTIKKSNDLFTETPLFVDKSFLSVFTMSVIDGNKETALDDPYSIVVSKDVATKYFGTADVRGEVMQIKLDTAFESFKITAIVENWPQNSSIKSGMLIPYSFYQKHYQNRSWVGGNLDTFLLLTENANVEAVENKMQSILIKNIADRVTKAKQEQDVSIEIKLGLQSLTDIHLSTEVGPGKGMTDGSKPMYSYILTCIAVFILIIACVNFINLTVGQSLRRSREIGIRKVIGSTRKQLIWQYLAESFIVTTLAFVIAIALTIVVLPSFNELANKDLSLTYLSDGYLYVAGLLLLLTTSLVAGLYPSIVLSSFMPVKVLSGRNRFTAKNYLAKGLITLQFGLTTFLVIGTIVINSQLDFLHHADLGYDSKHLVRIDLPSGKSSDHLPELFRSELLDQPGIINVAARNHGRTISGVTIGDTQVEIEYCKVNAQYLPTLNIPIIAGRNFSADFPADLWQSVIVNESFIKQAGWKVNDAIGKQIGGQHQGDKVTVIGVVKDYHFLSLKEKISPQVFAMDPSISFGELLVKIQSGDFQQTLARLQNTYAKLVPNFPFSYQFIDTINAKHYEAEAKWQQIITIASGLFILISCIGLVGLVTLSIEQQTKEIGIRKVLGAALLGIVWLFSREFIALVSIAFIVSVPVGYYIASKWLQNFAYRIDINWWMFAIAGASVILTALLTISFQTIKAGLVSPARNLRSE